MSKKVIRFINYNSRNDPENYARETDAVPTVHGEWNCKILLANKQRTVIILNAKTIIELKWKNTNQIQLVIILKLLNEANGADDNNNN